MQRQLVRAAAAPVGAFGLVARRAMVPAAGVARRRMATVSARPLSPHLEVYKLSIPMYASGAFRFAGMVMFFGIGGLSIINIPNTTPYQYYVWKLQQWPIVNWLVKFGVCGSITFHLLGGLRHLAWDSGVGHNMLWNRNTGLAAFGVTVGAALAASFTEGKAERQ